MKQTKHTPGPWKLSATEQCVSCDDFSIVVNKPNARLIACAPELLSALERLTWPNGQGNGLNERLSLKEHADIQKLITKAKGG